MSRARRGKLMVGAVLLASLSGTAGGLGASDAVSMKKITVRGVCVDQRSTPLYEVRVRIFRYASSIDAPELIAELTTDFEGKFVAENIETASDRTPLGGMGDLCVAATADRRASAIQRIDNDADDAEVSLMLPDDAGTLSGVVTDAAGKPVRGATVFLPFGFQQPLPDVRSAVTDEAGRYAIPDLKRWKSGEPNGQNRVVTSYNLLVQHPDYPQTMAPNTAVPQTLNITLQPAAVA
ncbi:MAG TPA: carboxypeptidase-like regulatory domain-containing protein, partial [Pirellulales bacterium]|nr:carboxypeptidase-like regulatory domain-containing protein [Pirellulales bacterium]